MPFPADAQKELEAIRASLSRALQSDDAQEWPSIVKKAVRSIDLVMGRMAQAGTTRGAGRPGKELVGD